MQKCRLNVSTENDTDEWEKTLIESDLAETLTKLQVTQKMTKSTTTKTG